MSSSKDYRRLPNDSAKHGDDITDEPTPPPTGEPMPPDIIRIISKQELHEHRHTEGDLWIAIDGGVYDVHAFSNRHPGGPEVLKGEKGTNASETFHLVGHSKRAVEMMSKFKIGIMQDAKTKIDDEQDDKFRTPKSKNCTIL